jgi:hypothetical protein
VYNEHEFLFSAKVLRPVSISKYYRSINKDVGFISLHECFKLRHPSLLTGPYGKKV